MENLEKLERLSDIAPHILYPLSWVHNYNIFSCSQFNGHSPKLISQKSTPIRQPQKNLNSKLSNYF